MEGYRAHSAYKLLEIEQKFSLIRKAKIIVELGSAPGGWTQVIREKASSMSKIFAFDLQNMEPIEGVEFIQIDCFKLDLTDILTDKTDLILSDMAPNNYGDSITDHLRSAELCLQSMDIAKKHLKSGGSLVFKITQGSEYINLLRQYKKNFASVKSFKPPASRKDSAEIYLIAQNFLIS